LQPIAIMKIAGALLLVLAAACAASEKFTPAERATAISPQGYTAADYEMVVEGERLGDAMVWSNGAHRTESGRTVVHVGFRVENDTDLPIEIAPEDVQIHVVADDQTIRRSQADIVEGARVVEPGREGTLALYFALPKGVSPQDVDAFRVSWKAHANGLEYVQRTPFLEYEEPVAYPYAYGGLYNSFYYSPFYDPFLYSPFYHRGLIVRPVPYRHYYFHQSARRR
jgi:hypothetical protein